MKIFYLMLAILGAILPLTLLFYFFFFNGFNINTILNELKNPFTLAFIVDLLISSIAFLIWSKKDSRRKHIDNWEFVFLGTFFIGLSFSMPFYLYLKESKKRKMGVK